MSRLPANASQSDGRVARFPNGATVDFRLTLSGGPYLLIVVSTIR